MKLYPQNLRDRQHARVIHHRATSGVAPVGAEAPPPHAGRLGRLWAKNSGLTERQAATGLPAAASRTMTTAWTIPILPAILGATIGLPIVFETGVPAALYYGLWAAGVGALSYLSAVPWAGAAFRALHTKPLTETEVEALAGEAAGDLERQYLTVVRDAVRQEVPAGQAEDDVRAAIQALGEAIDRLPVVELEPVDTAALREQARGIRAEAAAQTDRVIAESQERKADALLRRADSHERSARYTRRSAALRSEIEAQIAALREGLAAFHAGPSDAAVTADMAHLSESARRVAAEASSTADARAEVDALFPAATAAAAAPAAEPVVVRRGGG